MCINDTFLHKNLMPDDGEIMTAHFKTCLTHNQINSPQLLLDKRVACDIMNDCIIE